ncbi:hypothetical protein [Nonomuraea rubra]|uniref:hypothetical protein n=1 Tax=Nonomuraea rubra TaxID=46180 RepID=UPI0033C145AA
MSATDERFAEQVSRAHQGMEDLFTAINDLDVFSDLEAIKPDVKTEMSLPERSIEWGQVLTTLVVAAGHLEPIAVRLLAVDPDQVVKPYKVLRNLRNNVAHGGLRPEDLEVAPLLDATITIINALTILQRSASPPAASDSEASPQPVAHVARRVVGCSMLALPREHRRRYAEELHAELYDLAQAKATASMQVYYALRQFTRIWRLRNALGNPHSRRFETPHLLAVWTLSSEIRTWLAIGFVTLAALVDVVAKQGWGSAVLAVPTAWAFHRGACWLRERLDITVVSSKRESDDGPPPAS